MSRTFWVLSLSLAALGCSCGADEEAAPEVGETGDEARTTATVEGVVRLADGAELPTWPVNPMVPPQGRPELPEACTPAQGADARPVQVDGGGLRGAMVAMHDFADALGEHEPVTHQMTITDCRLTPQLVVATRGDHLVLRNETDYPFMPDFGVGMLQALLHEREREMELAQGGVRSLGCGFAAPCGRAEVVTLYHPLHALTGEGGRFRIEGIPPGEGVRVSAWHPLFLEASERLDLVAGQTATVELVLRPGPTPTPAPDPEAPTDPAEDDPDTLF